MDLQYLEDTLKRLVGLNVAFVSIRSALSLDFPSLHGDSRSISLSLHHPWSVEHKGVPLVTHNDVAFYESSFDSEAEWLAYKNSEAEFRASVEALVGEELLEITINPASSALDLLFSNEYRIKSPSDPEMEVDWSYRNKPEKIHFSVSERTGLETYPTELGEVIAQRNFAFQKDDVSLPAKLRISRPVPFDEMQPWGDCNCSFEITSSLGEDFFNVGGVDGVQALILALEMCQVKINALAAEHGATSYFLSHDSAVIRREGEEFETLHTLVGRMYQKIMSWNESVETDEMSENLQLLKECLNKLEKLRGKKDA